MKALLFLLLIFLSATASAQLLIAAKEKGKPFGYIDEKGNYVIPPTFDAAGPFYKGTAVVRKNKKFGIINLRGEFVVAPQYDDAIEYAPDGFITVRKSGKWGVIDQQGNIKIPLQHEYLSVVKEGFVIGGVVFTSKSSKALYQRLCPIVYGLNGEVVLENDCTDEPSVVLPGTVDKSGRYSEGAWPMVQNGAIVLEDVYGEEFQAAHVASGRTIPLYSITFPDHYARFREGVLAFQFKDEGESPGLAAYADTVMFAAGLASASSPLSYQANVVHPFFNNVAAVEQDGLWSFIDRDGDVISKTNLSTTEYRAAPPMYFNGLVGFFNGKGKAGYVNLKGETVIPFEFEEYHPFEWDVTPVKKNGLYGLLRKDGTWAVDPRFEDMYAAPCPCYQ
ncbi:MAG TPA: WG repeat-containing protein [Chryseosolibacter sp.]|nr:WG repeat-containing protein [Chryseosolibacter sp.]